MDQDALYILRLRDGRRVDAHCFPVRREGRGTKHSRAQGKNKARKRTHR
jgi:hypothetical protein